MQADLSSEKGRKRLLLAFLPSLPVPVSNGIVADPQLRQILGVGERRFVSVGGLQFRGLDFLQAVCDFTQGRAPSLVTVAGDDSPFTAEMQDQDAVFSFGDVSIRFRRAVLFGEDCQRRVDAFNEFVEALPLSPGHLEQWRQRIKRGPLCAEDFVELEQSVGETPQAFYRDLEADLQSREVTWSALVPSGEKHFLDLLGVETVLQSLESFVEAFHGASAGLTDEELVERIVLAGPLVIIPDLLADVAQRLPKPHYRKMVIRLSEAADPMSRLCAFELACRRLQDRELREIADELLPELLDSSAEAYESTGLLQAGLLFLATGTVGGGDPLARWPLYARRLARHLHSALLTRSLMAGNVDPSSAGMHAASNYSSQAYISHALEAFEEPYFDLQIVGPAYWHGYVLRRISSLLDKMAADLRPSEWTEALDVTVSTRTKGGLGLFMFVPGPLDGLSHGGEVLNDLPDELVEAFLAKAQVTSDFDQLEGELMGLSFALDVSSCLRTEAEIVLTKLVDHCSPSDLQSNAVHLLRVASRWRSLSLAGAIFMRLLDIGTDVDSLIRSALLAAAAAPSSDLWEERIAGHFRSIAARTTSSADAAVLIKAIDLVGVICRELAGRLVPVRALAVLGMTSLGKVTAEPTSLQ